MIATSSGRRPYFAMRAWVESLEGKICEGGFVTAEEAERLMECEGAEVYDLLPSAHRLARRSKGWDVELCGIIRFRPICICRRSEDRADELGPLIAATRGLHERSDMRSHGHQN